MCFHLIFGSRLRMLFPEGRSRFALLVTFHFKTHRIPAAKVLATLMLLSWANGFYDNLSVRRTHRLYLGTIEGKRLFQATLWPMQKKTRIRNEVWSPVFFRLDFLYDKAEGASAALALHNLA